MRKWFLLLIIIPGLLAFTGCAAATPSPTPTPTPMPSMEEEAEELTIYLSDFYFQVEGQEKNAPIRLEAGKAYKIVFKNTGTMDHELMIGRELKYEHEMPHGYNENLLEDVEVVVEGETKAGKFELEVEGLEEIELGPGVELEVALTIPEDRKGDWEIGCFAMMPDGKTTHYDLGMKAPVEIR